MRSRRAAKHADVLGLARACIEARRTRDSRHGFDRLKERAISIRDVEEVIATGWREPAKDSYKAEYSAWSYAICGRTLDTRNLRVVVAVERDEFGELISLITGIDLSI